MSINRCDQSTFFNLSELPIVITGFLDPYDLTSLSLVSKRLHKIANYQFSLLLKSFDKLEFEYGKKSSVYICKKILSP